MSDTSYNTYDKITSIDWNGQHFILTARNEITGNAFTHAYSSDGVYWTTNKTEQNPYSAKFLGDKFIIGGSGELINMVYGQFPVPISSSNTVFYDIERNLEQPHRIVFPKTATLALGNTIAYSNDIGHTWSNITSSPFSVSTNDAVWSGKLWVAVGTGSANTIATSLDGIHWTGRGKYIFAESGNGLDWSPSQKKYVAIGSSGIAASMDGIYWKPTKYGLFPVGNDIKWGGGLWVAVGNSASSGNTIAYSSDAVTWNYAANSFGNAGLRVNYDGVIWTAYGSDASYNTATSSDGIHWTLSSVFGATASITQGIPYILETSCNTISAINRYVCNHSDRGHAFIQPISIACGSGSCCLASSVDGIYWTAINTSLFSQCNKAVWNGLLWVVVGKGISGMGDYWVATSPDALCWTGRNNSLMTECYDVAWNGSYFVAVGIGSSVMATSPDGITWSSVSSIAAIVTAKIHAIEWTGNVWLAYGSGTNTTAVSSSVDASSWTATSTPNLCVMDCSNILANNILITTASSYQGTNITVKSVDGLFNTEWRSMGSNYDPSGNYIGTNVVSGQISGEWLQVHLTSPAVCANYYVVFSVAAIPRSWSFLGSTDGSGWTVLDTFNYGTSTPPTNYPYVCLPLVPSSTGSYQYYRIVFTSSFGTDYVSLAELALFDGGAKQLDAHIRPIVLKDIVLHPTRILTVDSAVPNIYRITDLSCNIIRSNVVHGGKYVNSVLYGLSGEPTATAFDGYCHFVFSNTGEVSYLSNTASNTDLNFDNSMNGVAISGVSGAIYAACFNRKFILAGSFYGTFGDDTVSPTFYPNNLSSLLTTSINGLASNSGYGFVVSPNTIYLKDNERLSLITPKYYDYALSSYTSVSFNVYKAT
jgi:hypothetical protein